LAVAFDGERPAVLVTLGTGVEDLALLNAALRGVPDADALVTIGFTTRPADLEGDPGRARAVSFAPIAQLLDRVGFQNGFGSSVATTPGSTSVTRTSGSSSSRSDSDQPLMPHLVAA
jgi:hypothetical protein